MDMQIVDYVKKLPVHETKRYERRRVSTIDSLVIHHSATPVLAEILSIAKNHIEQNQWPGIAYGWIITEDGKLYKCNLDSTVSYHAAGMNKRSVGICVMGNLDLIPPTHNQLYALLQLVNHYRRAYNIRVSRVLGHGETAKTACPGKNLDMTALRTGLSLFR